MEIEYYRGAGSVLKVFEQYNKAQYDESGQKPIFIKLEKKKEEKRFKNINK